MPADPSKNVDRFLRRLRRRGWGLRLVESSGVGLLVAAVGGVAVVAGLAERHRSAEAAVIALLAAGAAAGAMVGLFRRPGKLGLAEEADRQLHLPELLSSAATLPMAGARDEVDRALRRALAERAAAQCAGPSARRIRLRKFGKNAWGAIGLTAGVPVLLATLISPTPPARQLAGDEAQAMAAADGGDAPLVQLADTAAGPRQEMNPDEPVRSGRPPGDVDPATPPSDSDPSSDNGGHIAPPTPGGGPSGNASGAGNARTNVNQQPAPHPIDLTPGQTPSPANTSGTAAGGVGPAATAPPAPGNDNLASGAGRTVYSDRPPPWQTAGWPAEADAARHEADSGQIPAAYVDLVRDYFSRKGE